MFDPLIDGSWKSGESLYLPAVRLIAQGPSAKVLTIISQNIVAVLAQPRLCALHHFLAIEASSIVPYPYTMAMREALERNFLHWPAPHSKRETAVMNDAPLSRVDAVVAVKRASGNEM